MIGEASGETLLVFSEQLAELKQRGADSLNPSRFRYIETLLQKAFSVNDDVARRVLERAEPALQDYKAQLDQARSVASQQVEEIVQVNADLQEQAQGFLNTYEFRQLGILRNQVLNRERQRAFRVLSSLFNDTGTEPNPAQQQLSFDDVLMAHENEVVNSYTTTAIDADASGATQFADLKSHRLFKDTWVKLHAERIVSDAIKQLPDNAGPLNSQRLAIRSLEAMRELSPEYLDRFVSFMDSMLWLEQAAATLEAGEKKTKRKTRKNS